MCTEWKFSKDINTLSDGFFSDEDKFAEILYEYPDNIAKPYPILVGLAPLAAAVDEIGPGIQKFDLLNGTGLYLSTKETWAARGLLEYTAFGTGAEEQYTDLAITADALAVPVP